MTGEEALTELITRFEFHLEASQVIYGVEDPFTQPTLQAFGFAVKMAEALRQEIRDAES